VSKRQVDDPEFEEWIASLSTSVTNKPIVLIPLTEIAGGPSSNSLLVGCRNSPDYDFVRVDTFWLRDQPPFHDALAKSVVARLLYILPSTSPLHEGSLRFERVPMVRQVGSGATRAGLECALHVIEGASQILHKLAANRSALATSFPLDLSALQDYKNCVSSRQYLQTQWSMFFHQATHGEPSTVFVDQRDELDEKLASLQELASSSKYSILTNVTSRESTNISCRFACLVAQGGTLDPKFQFDDTFAFDGCVPLARPHPVTISGDEALVPWCNFVTDGEY